MKKILSILLILCLAATVFLAVACGNKDDDGSEEPTAEPGVTDQTNENGEGGTEGDPSGSEAAVAPDTTDGAVDTAQPGETDSADTSAAPGGEGQPGATPDAGKTDDPAQPGETDSADDPSSTDDSGEGASIIEDDGNVTIVVPSGQGSGGIGGNNP